MNSDLHRHRADEAGAQAWSAFAHDDARITAPAALETRVLDSWRAARDAGMFAPRAAPPRRTRWRADVPARLAMAAAAVVIATAAAIVYWPAARAPMPQETRTPAATPTRPSPAPTFPRAAAARSGAVANAPYSAPAATQTGVPDAVLTLAADPLVAAESLQLVRVRVPRQALQSLGVVLIDPDAEGTVEIDVLVGGDGLPRDIRRVQAAQEQQP